MSPTEPGAANRDPTDPAGIQIRVNGEQRRVPANSTVEDLLSLLGVPAGGVAVELAGRIVSRARFGETHLSEGQALEIVRFVGGG